MKNTFKTNQFLFAAALAVIVLSLSACYEELVLPSTERTSSDLPIITRSDGGSVNPALVKQKVATRDNIPLSQILTCSNFGQTTQGYWEYHLTTQYNGPKIYVVTKIIGEDVEGI
ncbi:MAG: hypothetical protein ABI462_14730 [Ignavibacteria bacterium]